MYVKVLDDTFLGGKRGKKSSIFLLFWSCFILFCILKILICLLYNNYHILLLIINCIVNYCNVLTFRHVLPSHSPLARAVP